MRLEVHRRKLAALSRHKTYFSTRIAEVVSAGYVQGEKIGEPSPLTARERETIRNGISEA
ncbi:MAG TPA: hypothetical protein VGO11_09245 [Chthoniobacteraceae bacterium]|jgi:hypothetical protein|nr:hypothetical protein [Chthoniobacteraceae bacterium]